MMIMRIWLHSFLGRILLFLPCILFLLMIYVTHAEYILKDSSDHSLRSDFQLVGYASASHIHEIMISIKQNNIDKLEKMLLDVSSPSSPNYGKYMSFEEVGELVENRVGTNAVIQWLHKNKVQITSQTPFGEYITAQATIQNWEQLLSTKFHEYKDIKTKFTETSNPIIIRAESYSLPDTIIHHIHALLFTIDLPPRVATKPEAYPIRGYEIKSTTTSESHETIMSSSSHMKLNVYGAPYATPATVSSMYDISGTGNGLGSQAVYETNSQTFLSSDLAYFQSYFSLTNDPIQKYVGSVPNSKVCKTSSNFQDCSEATLDVEYITGIANNVPTTYFYDSTGDGTFVSFITNITTSVNPANIYSISYTAYEKDISTANIVTFNTEAMKLGLRGVTLIVSSGDDGVTGFEFYQSSGTPISQCGYYAMWPASSPYVTTIGGTTNGPVFNNEPEIAASASTGSYITTGGGFSNVIPAPSWQVNAISNYTSKYNATQSSYKPYNTSNRGYPDLALASNSYIGFLNQTIVGFSGTSASTPVFAAMVALVNSVLIAQNKPPVGFLNPSIYGNNGGFTNDITSGSNFCTRTSSRCCSIGFKCTTGWDPVTGFGSVNYPSFLSYFQNIATYSPTNIPTAAPSRSPTLNPTIRPTSYAPSNFPTKPQPTFKPSFLPSYNPSFKPSINPTSFPSISPSTLPSTIPTNQPIAIPTFTPTKSPSILPSTLPTAVSSILPSQIPSTLPTYNPSPLPSILPTISPSFIPTILPSSSPIFSPSTTPSIMVTSGPTSLSTINPSCQPSLSPSIIPSSIPSILPSNLPTLFPTWIPSYSPSYIPTILPTNQPSFMPSISPSIYPTISPSIFPSILPTFNPTFIPSSYFPSIMPSVLPTSTPSLSPTILPSTYPSTSSSYFPTTIPSRYPTLLPTFLPSFLPTSNPTESPTDSPTFSPTTLSTFPPTMMPSNNPSILPSTIPSATPSFIPSSQSSIRPTINPTAIITSVPTTLPTLTPVTSNIILLVQNTNSLVFNFVVNLSGGKTNCISFNAAIPVNGINPTISVTFQDNSATDYVSYFEVTFPTTGQTVGGMSSGSILRRLLSDEESMHLEAVSNLGKFPSSFNNPAASATTCNAYSWSASSLQSGFSEICITNTCTTLLGLVGCSSVDRYTGSLKISGYSTTTTVSMDTIQPQCNFGQIVTSDMDSISYQSRQLELSILDPSFLTENDKESMKGRHWRSIVSYHSMYLGGCFLLFSMVYVIRYRLFPKQIYDVIESDVSIVITE